MFPPSLASLGHTRSANRRDHLVQTPDTFVRTSLPGLINGSAIVHAAPSLGAGFSMMTVELGAGGLLREAATQRFVYVLAGEIALREPGSATPHTLSPGDYAYLPADLEHTLSVTAHPADTRIVVIDKPFQPLDSAYNVNTGAQGPDFLLGSEAAVPSSPLNGDPDLQVRALLPDSPVFDFACNTMTYAPGAALSQVEVHTMEHGLLMLEGGGIYRLGESWYPTQPGDFIWMAPFCPQWFGAIGKTPAKYLIYKDSNRHPLTR